MMGNSSFVAALRQGLLVGSVIITVVALTFGFRHCNTKDTDLDGRIATAQQDIVPVDSFSRATVAEQRKSDDATTQCRSMKDHKGSIETYRADLNFLAVGFLMMGLAYWIGTRKG